MRDWGDLEGLIPILGGAVGLLLALGVLPRHPKDPARFVTWRRKYGRAMAALGVLLILFGVARLFGVLR